MLWLICDDFEASPLLNHHGGKSRPSASPRAETYERIGTEKGRTPIAAGNAHAVLIHGIACIPTEGAPGFWDGAPQLSEVRLRACKRKENDSRSRGSGDLGRLVFEVVVHFPSTLWGYITWQEEISEKFRPIFQSELSSNPTRDGLSVVRKPTLVRLLRRGVFLTWGSPCQVALCIYRHQFCRQPAVANFRVGTPKGIS